MIPPQDQLTICFAHVAYQLHERFSALDTGITSFAARDAATLAQRIGEADVLVISGLWQNSLLDRAGNALVSDFGAARQVRPRAMGVPELLRHRQELQDEMAKRAAKITKSVAAAGE